jgi:hypothetical protein
LFLTLHPSVARTTRRNTTPRLPSAGPEARVQPGETPLQDCPAPGRRPSVLGLHPRFQLPASRFLLPASCFTLHAPCSLLLATVFLPLLVAASHCRFYCRLSLPFGKTKSLCATIPPTNCRCRRNRGVEIGFSLFTVPRVAIEPRGVISNCSLLPASRFLLHASRFTLPAPCFTLLLSPVIAENLIQNYQLNQFVVLSAPVFALYLQELQ